MTGFDFTDGMRSLMREILTATPELGHIDMERILVIITPQRSRWRDGLFAQVTPLRFAGGVATTVHRGRLWRARTVVRDGTEILYVISFCLPRFLNRSFEEKMKTVFHEMYHISPQFNGDVRRSSGGRMHGRAFEAAVDRLSERFSAGHDRRTSEFLAMDYRTMRRKYGRVYGETFRIPHPKPVETWNVQLPGVEIRF